MLLDQILLSVPCPIFWKDLDSKFLGCNKLFLDIARLNDYSQLIGFRDYDFHWSEFAAEYCKDDQYVITTGNSIIRTEIIPMPNGTFVSETTKTPLIENGEIIGILGICYDISDRVEKEQLQIANEMHELRAQKEKLENLRLENELQKSQLQVHQEFKQIVEQVAHDIRSPLATMNMVLAHCDTLPENLRVTLNQSASRIFDIASHLLTRFSHTEEIPLNYLPMPTLISTDLLEIITEKRYEYSNLAIDFTVNISPAGYFSFINVDTKEFKRTISNLINNAVEALVNSTGKIEVDLDIIDNKVQIIIRDNGRGIVPSILHKILNAEVISDKVNGHGIGFSQVRAMLLSSDGSFDIESKLDVGTKIILTFTKIKLPDWIVDNIELSYDNLVVIVDDDPSIHGAWEAIFKKSAPNIQRKHFEYGLDAVSFINALSNEDKEKILLLTDYELLKQCLNGLDIITETEVKYSILVTSHHNNQEVRDLAKLTYTKILPKPLAAQIPMVVLGDAPDRVPGDAFDDAVVTNCSKLNNIDLIMVDDDKLLLDSYVRFLFNNMKVDTYFAPEELLINIAKYNKDIKIALDNHYTDSVIDGCELAQKLYAMGFTNLYIISGENPEDIQSKYATAILKTDLNEIKKHLHK